MAGEDDLARARHAIGTIESSNNYGITGPATGGNVPLGRYQVMSSNLPSWSQEALGRQVSPQEYLSSPGLQDQLFNHHFGKYMDKYGPEGASRAWFGGEGSVYKNSGSKDILGTSVGGYGSKFSSLFNGGAGADGQQMAQGDGGPPGSPADAGFGHMSDDELKAIAAQPDTDSSDLSHMSDDELKAIAGGDDQSDGYSLGGLAQNAGTDLGNIWEGVKATGKRALSDVGSAVQGNFAPAAGDMVSTMKALNPFLAAAKNVQQGAPMVKEAITDPAQAAKDTADYVYQKPVTSAMNAAAVAFPGAAPGAVLKGATSAVRGADAVLAPTLGRVLTGLPGSLQREASRAGEAGGAQGAAFRGQFKGTAPGDVTVDLAKGAAKDIQDASYAEKKAGENQWAGKSVDAGAPADVQTALADARKSNRDVAGIVQSPETEVTLDALQGHLDTAFPGGKPLNGQSLSVDAFDALKRRMGDTLSKDGGAFDTGPGSQAYHATRQALVDAYPDYAGQMEKSQTAIESAKQMRKQLSLGSTNDATVAGALQRAARNDASGAYGMRKDQLMKLVQQKPELLSAISGQAMNAAHPRGITPMLALSIPGHVALGPMGAVTGLLQYALGIPKLHGTARYALGALTRRTGNAGFSQANIGRILDIARIVGQNQQGASSDNLSAATSSLKLTPQEQALYQRHLTNLHGPGGVDNADGSRSTLFQMSTDIGGKTYNLPTVYDGKILSPDAAVARARKEGLDKFPSYSSGDEAEKRYEAMHQYMDKDTSAYFSQKNKDQ